MPYKEIDFKKWDDCIHRSCNGLIYCTAAYLDAMAANWDAIILNDYEAVMPLTWKKKFTIRYLYQPAFFQQGGIISSDRLSEEMNLLFLETAFTHFSFAEITLNFNNALADDFVYLKNYRNNYILPLHENVAAQLNDYVLKRVRRAVKNELYYETHDDFDEIILLYKDLYHKKMDDIEEVDFLHFRNYCATHRDQLVLRKVIHQQEIVAAVLMLKDPKRLYNIVSCILPEGKKLLANYFLFYSLIDEFKSSEHILDFEGSDKSGIAFFYKKFASENQRYPFIKMNRLPAPLKLFKR